MTWFEINCNHIISKDYNPWSADNGAVWGLYKLKIKKLWR